jgi:hypothetical protein
MPQQLPHYLKGEPQVSLWQGGPTFSLFYDYDQIRDGKLSGLKPEQKAIWFRARTEMTFLDPVRRIFSLPPSSLFNELMDASFSPPRSFSIAIMSVMLNGVEALGSFLRPDLCLPIERRNDNKGMFKAFMEIYVKDWWQKPVPGGNPDVAELLWSCFRIGIAHGFCIKEPGSLEFLENERFRWTGKVLQVCPLHLFQDLDQGAKTYFSDLQANQQVLEKFTIRFDHVYKS